MQREPARGLDPDPKRASVPPVRTRRVHSDAPDPGAVSGRLPPFRPGWTDASHVDIIEPGDVDLEPIAGSLRDSDTGSRPDPAAAAHERGRREPTEPTTEADLEETWLLDEVVEADAETDQAWAETGEASPGLDVETPDREPEAEEAPWDSLGEALQQAVTRANPPLAEDLVESSEPTDPGGVGEPQAAAQASTVIPSQEPESDRGEAAVAGPLDVTGRPTPPADPFAEGLASTLESLASGLRARGFNALDDAFARGDRLESSLALFLAGYRAGRGE